MILLAGPASAFGAVLALFVFILMMPELLSGALVIALFTRLMAMAVLTGRGNPEAARRADHRCPGRDLLEPEHKP